VAVHGFLRQWLAEHFDQGIAEKVRILYGGSLKPANARSILALKDVDGGLIGAAALKAFEFLAICDALPDNRQ
jgi:triosephosphate isomerase